MHVPKKAERFLGCFLVFRMLVALNKRNASNTSVNFFEVLALHFFCIQYMFVDWCLKSISTGMAVSGNHGLGGLEWLMVPLILLLRRKKPQLAVCALSVG
jgi:hypothetical protein